jgi:hypothetical protein
MKALEKRGHWPANPSTTKVTVHPDGIDRKK